MAFINLNGEIVSATEKIFAADDRITRYGDGLFESIRALNGTIPFWQEHYERLFHGAKLLNLTMPTNLDANGFREQLIYLLKSNGYQNARMRFMLYRNGKGLYLPFQNEAGYLIEALEIPENSFVLNINGLQTGLYTEHFKSCDSLSSLKTNNSLIYVLASIFKQNQKFDEVFLINQKGFICESSSANLFIVKNEELITPAGNQGCIMGVMRRIVINLAKRNNLSVTESCISIDDMKEASEVFITNASMGIQWVSSFQNYVYETEKASLINIGLNKSLS
jgi:branched-chain amino acid aminotransferase